MGMDIAGVGGCISFNIGSWEMLFKLGMLYGWEPAGTVLYDEAGNVAHDWSGSYFSNDYQEVSSVDALNWATAIDASLIDIPNHNAMAQKVESRPCGDLSVDRIIDEADVVPIEWFSGEDGKKTLRKFVALCRRGPFRIG